MTNDANALTPADSTQGPEDDRWQSMSHLHNQLPSWQQALVLTIALRVTYSVLAAIIVLVQPVNWDLVHSNALTENLPAPNASLNYLVLGAWQRFDTLWYLHIVAAGRDLPASVVFFPMYPWLIRICSHVMTATAAALLIATAASFFLFWGLTELFASEIPADLAQRSIWLCCVWPASFIFFAGYPESLVLALIVWSLVMARAGRWPLAAVLGVAASLTKAVGVVVAVPLIVLAIRQKKPAGLLAIATPLGALGYMAWLRWTSHNPIGFVYSHYWRTSLTPPWTTLWIALSKLLKAPDPLLALNLIALATSIILVLYSGLSLEFLLYGATAILIFLTKQTSPALQSTIRYLLIVFPMFVGMARLTNVSFLRTRLVLVCSALFVVNVALLWLFLGWALIL